MYTIERTAAELKRRIEMNKFQPITLNLKTGDTVRIIPCYGRFPSKIEDCEFFQIESVCTSIQGSNVLEEVAYTLNNFAAIKEKEKLAKQNLHEAYQRHIEGYTGAERHEAMQIYRRIHELWCQFTDSGHENLDIDQYIEKHTKWISKTLGITKNKLKCTVRLAHHIDMYQDNYKMLYGVKAPHMP